MELEFQISQTFDDDIKSLPEENRVTVIDKINLVATSFMNGKKEFNENASVPYIFTLKGGYESSLYLIKADNNNRIIAAVDEDPIFDKISFLLFRIIDKS